MYKDRLNIRIPHIASLLIYTNNAYDLKIHRVGSSEHYRYHIRSKLILEVFRDENTIYLIDSEREFDKHIKGKEINVIEGDIESSGLFIYLAPFEMPSDMEAKIVRYANSMESPLKDQGSPTGAYLFDNTLEEGSIRGIYFSDMNGVYVEGIDSGVENHAWENIIIRGGLM